MVESSEFNENPCEIDQNRLESAKIDENRPPPSLSAALQVVRLPPEALSETRVGALLASKVIKKPLKKQKCGILPMVESAHPGYGWLAEQGHRAEVPAWH